MRRNLVFLIACAFCALPAAANAGGGPVTEIDGAPGVISAARDTRFMTVKSGGNTVVTQLRVPGGGLIRSRTLPGRWSIPAVGYDASPTGLSGDGGRLVVVKPRTRFPVRESQMLVLDTTSLDSISQMRLKGDFALDAISPDGATIYLVNYVDRKDPTLYSVRAFDVQRGKLLSRPVIDPNEKGPMAGVPVTRQMGTDGRWAYTLYDGQGAHPFIHALDTVNRTAKCIDLDNLAGRDDLYVMKLRLGGDGGQLAVVAGKQPVALVDTANFAVTEPRAAVVAKPPRQARGAGAANGDGGGGFPWLVLLALAGGAVAVGVAGVGMRRSAGGARAR
jgi:hypothetical protein